MTSKNDLMNKLREQDVLLTALLNGTGGITRSLAALEKAQNQPATDPDELERLRTANEQLIQQNSELTASNQRIRELSTRRWKDIQDLRAENARLRELLAVADQHAGEIVRALAVAESGAQA